jgi:hypothetical protein
MAYLKNAISAHPKSPGLAIAMARICAQNPDRQKEASEWYAKAKELGVDKDDGLEKLPSP